MLADLRSAFSFLTIMPLGYSEDRKPGWSFAWYPCVGLMIGLMLWGIAEISPFEDNVTAFLILGAWIIITGGLHLDGFGDSCDGLLATVEPIKRLEIMKDPRAGSWAVIGLILLLLGKWTLIPAVPAHMLIIPPMVGRWVMVIAVYHYPYARSSGLGGYFRDGFGRSQVMIASAWLLLLLPFGIPGLIALGIGIFNIFVIGGWAARRLGGGITGDIYGALCELTELACLIGIGLC